MELHFTNTKSVNEFRITKGILFLDTAKVFYGDIDDLELRVSVLKDLDLISRKFRLGEFSRSKQSSIHFIDFKKHVNTRSWITISEPSLVRFSITNYVEHRTIVNCFKIDF